MLHRYRLGVDVGGTFTDFALADTSTAQFMILKVPTTPQHPSSAILNGVGELTAAGKLDVAQIDQFVHGTTLALNTILERKGAQVGLLVTRGFRDVLQLRRLRLEDPSNLNSDVPEPLIPRSAVAEVDERMRADGSVETPLDPAQLLAAAGRLVARGAQALVISFLHSYRNPAHEEQARALVTERYPDLYVCTSSEIWPQQREYERTLLSVMNAYLGRRMRDYFVDLTGEMSELGLPGPIFSTRSNGGILTATSAAATPVVTLLSGPAAGVIGAAHLARQAGLERIVTLDMGGTSADVAVVDGQPGYSTENRVGDYPVIMPTIAISSIGAGGGSIAWTDKFRVLKVGPQSSGAEPGPACYDRGGIEPAVTDAYLLLGIIDPDHFLGGTMRLNRARAEEAVGRIAEQIGRPLLETAAAIIDVATANMEAQFLPLMARQGVDPTQFTLVPYGGAGPTHAFLLARQVGIRRVMVPPTPGALSALGCLVADLRADFVSTLYSPLADLSDEQLSEAYSTLVTQAEEWLRSQEVEVESVELIHSADVRYVGQSFEITTTLPTAGAHSRAELAEQFHRQYEQIYHYADRTAPVELVNIRVQIVGVTKKPDLHSVMAADPSPNGAAPARRPVYLDGQMVDVAVYNRAELAPGQTVAGPCVIEQYDTTVFVPTEFVVRVDRFGNLIGEAV